VLSFLRYGKPAKADGETAAAEDAASGSALACVVNFSGSAHHGYRIGLPRGGHWREVLNTDAEGYGGSGVGNLGGVDAEPEPWHGQPYSATVAAPPLGSVWFLHEG
jgi:1,4-alpha-glucan branching enzyme